MRTLTEEDLAVPKRHKESHKGEQGRVLVVGGSEDYTGAVALAGLAALRCNADLVTIAAPEKVAWAINCLSADLITKKLPGSTLGEEHYDAIEEIAQKSDVLLIGNGMGQAASTKNLIRKLAHLEKKMVFDADALKALSVNDCKNSIITPHKAELRAFLENSGIAYTDDPHELQDCLRQFIEQGNVILLKGSTDYVIGKEIACNKTGNPGMTKGGTGDVLAGLCAGYYTLLDAWHSACNAAYLNGKIADQLKEKRGYTYLASDIVEDLKRFRTP